MQFKIYYRYYANAVKSEILNGRSESRVYIWYIYLIEHYENVDVISLKIKSKNKNNLLTSDKY